MRKALYVMGFLDDSDIEWIAAHGSRAHVAKDEVLIHEGRPIDSLYVLLAGSLSVTTGGKEVASLFSGEIVGEISFVDSRPPGATVRAGEDSRVLAMPRGTLQKKLDSDPSFASRFYRALATFLADRLRMTTSRLGYGDPSQDRMDRDEMNLDMLDNMSLAAVRFDKFLKRLSGGPE